MKKEFSLLLAACMVLGAFGCGQQTEKAGLKVGFGRCDITPSYSVPLAGYGRSDSRMSDGFLDKLYATCIAVTDGDGSTVLLLTVDSVCAYTAQVETVRQAVTEATGVPADRILYHGTHSHSAPDLGYTHIPSILRYKEEFLAGVAKAAGEAMADRAAATIQAGTAYTENMNFVRHYTTEEGVAGDNFGNMLAKLTGHVSQADNRLAAVRFCREGKKDVVLVNYQAHPKMVSTSQTQNSHNRLFLSADYVGTTRSYVEQQADVLFAFFLGAAGNLNNYSQIAQENRTLDYKVYGQLLGDYVLDALSGATPVAGDAVRITGRVMEIPVDHSEDHLIEAAKKVAAAWNGGATAADALAAGAEPAIISPYHATSIINRYSDPETHKKLELMAFSVGEVGFVAAPYEMFDSNGCYIREQSPFPLTCVFSCSNGAYAYVADENAFSYYSYEAYNRRFPRGTAESLAETMVKMLDAIHPTA